MKKNFNNILNNNFIILLLIIPFVLPLGLKYFSITSQTIYNFLKNIKVIIFAIFFVYYFVHFFNHKIKINLITLAIVLFELSFIITSLINQVDFSKSLGDFISIVGATMLIDYFFQNKKEKNLFNIVYIYYSILYFLNFLSVIIFYDTGISGLYTNFVNPLFFMSIDNGMAGINIFYLILVELKYKNNKSIKHYLLFLVPLLTAILIKSGSCIIVTIFLELMLISYKHIVKKSFLLIISLFLIIIQMSIFIGDTSSNPAFNFIITILGRTSTGLTGRNLLWEGSIKMFYENPLFGYGDTIQDHLYIWGGYFSSHNFYIEILLDGGLFSMIFFIFLITITLYKQNKMINNKMCKIVTIGILGYLIFLFVEASGQIVTMFVLFAIIGNLTKMDEKENRQNEKLLNNYSML